MLDLRLVSSGAAPPFLEGLPMRHCVDMDAHRIFLASRSGLGITAATDDAKDHAWQSFLEEREIINIDFNPEREQAPLALVDAPADSLTPETTTTQWDSLQVPPLGATERVLAAAWYGAGQLVAMVTSEGAMHICSATGTLLQSLPLLEAPLPPGSAPIQTPLRHATVAWRTDHDDPNMMAVGIEGEDGTSRVFMTAPPPIRAIAKPTRPDRPPAPVPAAPGDSKPLPGGMRALDFPCLPGGCAWRPCRPMLACVVPATYELRPPAPAAPAPAPSRGAAGSGSTPDMESILSSLPPLPAPAPAPPPTASTATGAQAAGVPLVARGVPCSSLAPGCRSGLQVALVETNGLPHQLIPIQGGTQVAAVRGLDWNATGEILAVLVERPHGARALQFYMTSNYEWFLKMELDLPTARLPAAPRTGSELLHWRLHTQHTVGPRALITATNGRSVMSTPYGMHCLPPPLYHRIRHFPEPVNEVSFNWWTALPQAADALGDEGLDPPYVALLSTGALAWPNDTARVVPLPAAIWGPSAGGPAGPVCFSTAAPHMQWLTPGLVALSVQAPAPALHLLGLLPGRPARPTSVLVHASASLPAPVAALSTPFLLQPPGEPAQVALLVHCTDGSVQRYVAIPGVGSAGPRLVEGGRCPFALRPACPTLVRFGLAGDGEAIFGLAPRGDLLCDGRLLLGAVNSIGPRIVYQPAPREGQAGEDAEERAEGEGEGEGLAGVLLAVTMANQMRFIPVRRDGARPAPLEYVREVERGARLVCTVETDTKAILQVRPGCGRSPSVGSVGSVVSLLPSCPDVAGALSAVMPRGLMPRPLVLLAATQQLDRLQYGAAFALLRTHRCDLNLLADHRPLRFVRDLPLLVGQLATSEALDLLLASLAPPDCTRAAYAPFYLTARPAPAAAVDGKAGREAQAPSWSAEVLRAGLDVFVKTCLAGAAPQDLAASPLAPWLPAAPVADPRPAEPSGVPALPPSMAVAGPPLTKPNLICRALQHLLLHPRPEWAVGDRAAWAGRWMGAVLGASFRQMPPDVEGMLAYIKAQPQGPHRAAALEHAAFLCGRAEVLYEVALCMYDMELAREVAGHTQQDPQEYRPFLDRMAGLAPLALRIEVDAALHRWPRVMFYRACQLATRGDPDPEAVAAWMRLVDEHGLHQAAIALPQVHACGPLVGALQGRYAERLLAEERTAEAALLFLHTGNYRRALDAYTQGSHWTEALALAGTLGLDHAAVRALAARLAAQLSRYGRHAEAARVYEEYLHDLGAASRALIEAHQWVEALRVAGLPQPQPTAASGEDAGTGGYAEAAGRRGEVVGAMEAALREEIDERMPAIRAGNRTHLRKLVGFRTQREQHAAHKRTPGPLPPPKTQANNPPQQPQLQASKKHNPEQSQRVIYQSVLESLPSPAQLKEYQGLAQALCYIGRVHVAVRLREEVCDFVEDVFEVLSQMRAQALAPELFALSPAQQAIRDAARQCWAEVPMLGFFPRPVSTATPADLGSLAGAYVALPLPPDAGAGEKDTSARKDDHEKEGEGNAGEDEPCPEDGDEEVEGVEDGYAIESLL
ncbi:putative elongator complex protein 1 [Paratrimastix pyriformis]|uniref:Elongator complex protein 1 n=1 Tax=Paratrimastix pyriformis TaxID=342808 RepID=A0ABQ8UKK3_9EUKA|nr:putative elongator complex protein 1 [Paratrimastix pyriformis]